jgi:hypothetical protein
MRWARKRKARWEPCLECVPTLNYCRLIDLTLTAFADSTNQEGSTAATYRERASVTPTNIFHSFCLSATPTTPTTAHSHVSTQSLNLFLLFSHVLTGSFPALFLFLPPSLPTHSCRRAFSNGLNFFASFILIHPNKLTLYLHHGGSKCFVC